MRAVAALLIASLWMERKIEFVSGGKDEIF